MGDRKVEIKFIKSIVNAGRNRKVVYIPAKLADKVEVGKKYLIIIKGPIEEEEIIKILEKM